MPYADMVVPVQVLPPAPPREELEWADKTYVRPEYYASKETGLTFDDPVHARKTVEQHGSRRRYTPPWATNPKLLERVLRTCAARYASHRKNHFNTANMTREELEKRCNERTARLAARLKVLPKDSRQWKVIARHVYAVRCAKNYLALISAVAYRSWLRCGTSVGVCYEATGLTPPQCRTLLSPCPITWEADNACRYNGSLASRIRRYGNQSWDTTRRPSPAIGNCP